MEYTVIVREIMIHDYHVKVDCETREEAREEAEQEVFDNPENGNLIKYTTTARKVMEGW